jgi:hypothetical protein
MEQLALLATAYPGLPQAALAALATLWGTSKPPVWAVRPTDEIAYGIAQALGGRQEDTSANSAIKRLRAYGMGIRTINGIGHQLVCTPPPTSLALRVCYPTGGA